jgi:hypothetical protein
MPTIKIPCFALDFEPPLAGFQDEFNTFRLGLTWSKKLQKGDLVLLFDTKEKAIFGRAKVLGIETGKLIELAQGHAHMNHNQLGKAPMEAAYCLVERVRKRYGPHIARDDKKCTVIYLRRKD